MKHLAQLLFILGLFLVTISTYAEDAPDSVKQLAKQLRSWGENPVLVAAVKQENAKLQSLDAIKKRDAIWRATSGIDEFMKALLNNDAAKELARLEKSKAYYFELFLMDNQGANVAMTNKTSDYWQGDEAKFTHSYQSGQGGVHISKVEFDESSQAYLVQVSIPIMEGDSAIGALTIGINVDILEQQ